MTQAVVNPTDPNAVGMALTELHTLAKAAVGAEELDVVGERVNAGNFALWFGALGDWYKEPTLSKIQFSASGGMALSLLAHWSVERNDPAEHRPASYLEEHVLTCEVCLYLEKVYELRRLFTVGDNGGGGVVVGADCPGCHRGIEFHDARPRKAWGEEGEELFFWGEPQSWCRIPWSRVDAQVFARDAFGPHQASEAFRVCWVASLVDGLYAVVTRTYMLAVEDGERTLEREDAYYVCSDPDDPERTAVQSESGTEELDADDLPLHDHAKVRDELVSLADESFPPDPGEFQTEMPHAPTFIWT
jgi:hypothetical protein